jgi:hypothetical protein
MEDWMAEGRWERGSERRVWRGMSGLKTRVYVPGEMSRQEMD